MSAPETVIRFERRGAGESLFARVSPRAASIKIHGEFLRGETLRVYIAMAAFADRAGWCWPSTTLIASRSGVDRRHVYRALGQLADADLLRIISQAHGKNRYLIVGISATGGTEGCATGGREGCATGGTRAKKNKPAENRPGEHMNPRAAVRRGATAFSDEEMDCWFEQLAQAYPPRPGNPLKQARGLLAKLVQQDGEEPQRIVSAAKAYAVTVAEIEDRRFIPYLSTWLKRKQFADPMDGPVIARPSRPGSVLATVAALNAGPLRAEQPAPIQSSPTRPSRIPGGSFEACRKIVQEYKAKGGISRHWPAGMGVPPHHSATYVPDAIRKEFGFA